MSIADSFSTTRSRPPAALHSAHYWLPVSRYEGWTAKRNNVIAGYDLDGSAWYVARLMINGRTLPGIAKSGGDCSLLYNGIKVKVSSFEILRNDRLRVWWQSEMNGHVPPESMPIGADTNGNKIFVGKHVHVGILCIGTIDTQNSSLRAMFGGKEQQFSNYEVLCGQPE